MSYLAFYILNPPNARIIMSTKIELSRITIDIPKVDHKKLKALAALHERSMREIIVELIKQHLECGLSHYPNKKTQDVLRNIEEGKNLVEAKNINDLFQKLGM